MLRGRMTRDGIPALCERIREVLEPCDPGPVILDIGDLADPDAVTVDALARLQLTAVRLGFRIRVRDACGELRDLFVLTGLVELLPEIGTSGLEPLGKPEQREQMRGVEEEADP